MKTSAIGAATMLVAALQSAAAQQQLSVASQPGESHLTNIRQITFGGENAEAYFSRDGQWLTFQSTREGHTCDQQYVMRLDLSLIHISEPTRLLSISYAVFCLKK